MNMPLPAAVLNPLATPLATVTGYVPGAPIAGITLTQDQQNVMDAFVGFLMDPDTPVFVIEGYAGTGKSTLVRCLMDVLPSVMKAVRLLNPMLTPLSVELTATTNKAAEALSEITGGAVCTIHSHLGLRLEQDLKDRNKSVLKVTTRPVEDELIFIDEASYIDSTLLDLIFKQTENCKIVFMGDPAQLAAVNCNEAPVFKAGFSTASLTQVMRQAAGNPIVDLATKFRETVNTGQWFSFVPDGYHIQHVSREDFEQAIIKDFTRTDWGYGQSMVLAWRNEAVVTYNKAIRDFAIGDPDFKVGDYVLNNSYVQHGKASMKTDQMVRITKIGNHVMRAGVQGRFFGFEGVKEEFFVPNHRSDAKAAHKQASKNDDWHNLAEINAWADIRAVYASTVNKSQGSTYDKVFIDLDDLARCRNTNTLARMLYVAVSRARHHVIMTGDLV